jgi:pullulanase/glycogen debranching enzyme
MIDSLNGSQVEAAFGNARAPQVVRVPIDGVDREVHSPFPSPADWRDVPIYFLLVDRFANPVADPRQPHDSLERIFEGCTLDGVRSRLDYIAGLGIGAIWLSPVLMNCQYRGDSYHGYGIQDFLTVDPRFASNPAAAAADPSLADDELRALVDTAHARGIHVILDIVLNHRRRLRLCRRRGEP